MANLPDLPQKERLTYTRGEQQDDPSKQEGKVTRAWLEAFQRFMRRFNVTAYEVGRFKVSDRAAALAATPIVVTESDMRYRVNYYTRVIQPGGVSSALQVAINWVDRGVVCSRSGALLNTNTTGTLEGDTFLIRADAATAIAVSVSYASAGAPAMTFDLEVKCEGLPV